MVKCMRCVYGSNLWNKFTDQVCWCYFGTHFMRSYFMSILGVVFLDSVFSLIYGYIIRVVFTGIFCGIGLRAEFAIRVLRLSLQIKCTSRVY